MLHSLIDRVSKNGTMLLNIAPMADGTIPRPSSRRSCSAWATTSAASVSRSTPPAPGPVYGEGPTQMGGGAFTTPTWPAPRRTSGSPAARTTPTLYATVLGWPGSSLTLTTLASGRIDLRSLASAQLLDSSAGMYRNLPTPTQDAAGLHLTLPAAAPFTAPAYVLKLTFSGQIPTLRPIAGALVFENMTYSGASAVLALGNYTASQLTLAGLHPLSLSSLRLALGYQIIGYSGDNFTGTAWTFTTDNADLRATSNNDTITSLKVMFNQSAWLRITNVANGLVLDSGGNVAGGSNLKQWTWNGDSNLQWQAVELGNGYYKLVNRTNGMVADGWGATANGAAARQLQWNGHTNQQWLITHGGDGRYSIANRTTGMVLDGGGNVSAGSVTKQWASVISTNLQWTLTSL